MLNNLHGALHLILAFHLSISLGRLLCSVGDAKPLVILSQKINFSFLIKFLNPLRVIFRSQNPLIPHQIHSTIHKYTKKNQKKQKSSHHLQLPKGVYTCVCNGLDISQRQTLFHQRNFFGILCLVRLL